MKKVLDVCYNTHDQGGSFCRCIVMILYIDVTYLYILRYTGNDDGVALTGQTNEIGT